MKTELIIYKDYSYDDFIYFIYFDDFKFPLDYSSDNSHLWENRIIISHSTAIGKQLLSDNYNSLDMVEFPNITFCLGQSPSQNKYMTKRQLYLKFLGSPRFLASTSSVFYRNWKHSPDTPWAPWVFSRGEVFLFQALPLDKESADKIIYPYLLRAGMRTVTPFGDLKIIKHLFKLNEYL